MNKVTSLHKTLIKKFLVDNNWVETADHESGSTYFALREDSTIKFRISDHFFAAFYSSAFQIILSDLQPNMYVLIINGNSVVCNSIAEVKNYIITISNLYRCSAKFFSSKGVAPKELDAQYWKKKFDEEHNKTLTLENKLEARQPAFNKQEMEKINKIKQENTVLKQKNDAQKKQLSSNTTNIQRLKQEVEKLKKELQAAKTEKPVSYKITSSLTQHEDTVLSNVG